jgi:hypothetical protein
MIFLETVRITTQYVTCFSALGQIQKPGTYQDSSITHADSTINTRTLYLDLYEGTLSVTATQGTVPETTTIHEQTNRELRTELKLTGIG